MPSYVYKILSESKKSEKTKIDTTSKINPYTPEEIEIYKMKIMREVIEKHS